jgi:hypothetical protein
MQGIESFFAAIDVSQPTIDVSARSTSGLNL